MVKKQNVSALVFSIFMIAAFVLTAVILKDFDGKDPLVEKDFIEYWAAFKLLQKGLNPYDLTLLGQIQSEAGRHLGVLPMLNPPYTLILLSPVLFWGFKTGFMLWSAFNLYFVFQSAMWIWRMINPGEPVPSRYVWTFFLFYPLTLCLFWGQTSLFIVYALVGFVWSVKKRREVRAGLYLFLMTIKPHLLYLLIPVFMLWMIRKKKFKVLAGFFAASFLGVMIPILLNPGILSQWIEILRCAKPFFPSTFTGFVRQTVWDFTAADIPWIQTSFSWIVLFLTTLWVLRKREGINLGECFILLCLSLFSAPYGWTHDQALLLPVQGVMTALVFRRGAERHFRTMTIRLIVMLQGALCLQILLALPDPINIAYFFWFPIGQLALWLWFLREQPQESRLLTAPLY